MKNAKHPTRLSDAARTLWQRLRDDFEIEDAHGQHLLTTACESYDRMTEAQALIREHGVCIRDRFGVLKANPACQIERDSRAGMLTALKALRLDIEPLGPIGRPPGS